MNIKTTIQSLLIIFSITLYSFSFSQNSSKRFGKVSIEDLKNNVCPIDSNAQAYFMFDYGKSYFEFINLQVSSSGNSGFKLFYTRHFMLKIIGNQGFSWANFKIPLYYDGHGEKITKFKAVTYNLENGKIIETKLKKKDILTEKTAENWNSETFAMPNVREGSIIEITYTIESDFLFNLRSWYFQQTIPILQSEYHVTIPEYLKFNQISSGFFPIQKKVETTNNEIKISSTNSISFMEACYHYYAKNITAFSVEQYLRTKENYLSKVDFELSYTKFPNVMMHYFTTTWEEINKDLNDHYYFGKELNKSSHLKNDVKKLSNLTKDKMLLLNEAFRFMKRKMSWNKFQSKYVYKTLRKAYIEGVGNTADINLNLVVLLRELGFNAEPVILSTQENGIIYPDHPSVIRFNYVIASVKLDNKTYLMDATDPYSEINLLPIRCLNDRGRIVNESGGDWIDLMDYKPYSLVETYNINIDDNLQEMSGINQMRLNDYAAYQYKTKIKEYNNLQEYKTAIERKINGYKINDLSVSGLDTIREGIDISMEFSQQNYIDQAGNIAFLKPDYQPFISDNPFVLENREYPIEYNYPYKIQQIYTITIPDKYVVSELPEPINAKTPDGSIRYVYNIQQFGNKINLTIMFLLNRSFFSPQEYQTVKNFYQMIVDKQNENIVLKVKE